MWEWLNRNGAGITAIVAILTIILTGVGYFGGNERSL